MSYSNRLLRLSTPSLLALLVFPLALLLIRPVVAEDRNLDPEVETILRERLGLLQEVAKLRHEAYRSGSASLASTLASDQAVLEAELELAKSPGDRVRVREEMLKVAETLEKAAEKLSQASEAPRMNLLAARASRLRATANLVLERKTAR